MISPDLPAAGRHGLIRSVGVEEGSLPEEASPATSVVRVTIEVTDPLGLHMRSAGTFTRAAGRYRSHISLRQGDLPRDAKSILDVLMIAAGCGTQLLLEASGPDAEEAIRELSGLAAICKAI